MIHNNHIRFIRFFVPASIVCQFKLQINPWRCQWTFTVSTLRFILANREIHFHTLSEGIRGTLKGPLVSRILFSNMMWSEHYLWATRLLWSPTSSADLWKKLQINISNEIRSSVLCSSDPLPSAQRLADTQISSMNKTFIITDQVKGLD